MWLELLFKYKVCSSGKSHCTTQELDLLSGTPARESMYMHAALTCLVVQRDQMHTEMKCWLPLLYYHTLIAVDGE